MRANKAKSVGRPRIVICDVYGTLLAVSPPGGDVERRWEALHRSRFGEACPSGWHEYSRRIQERIVRSRARDRELGVSVPEVVLEEVVADVIPAFRDLDPKRRRCFLLRQAELTHSVELHAGAARVIRRLHAAGVLLGIASNAQAYSEAELARELRREGLSSRIFREDLSFWSWRHGYSKPDPHVFQWLDTRARLLGVASNDVLMVGDRVDNDVEPARSRGWQTWHLCTSGSEKPGGNWSDLSRWLEGT